MTLFGENRVQEALAKVPEVPSARWHLVGPLQSNKARRAIEAFDMIETLDSVALAQRLDRIAGELGRASVPVLLQVNVDRDVAKSGFAPEELPAAIDEVRGLARLVPGLSPTQFDVGGNTVGGSTTTGARSYGRSGEELNDVWDRKGTGAHLGITVSGFPNMFLLVGPNTGLGHSSMVFMIERQVDYVMQALGLLESEDAAYVDVHEPRQEHHSRFLIELPVPFAANWVLVSETKPVDDFNVTTRNSRFFLQLAQRTLHLRLTVIHMPFGQIPSVCVTHQQKLAHALAAHDQKAARLVFEHVQNGNVKSAIKSWLL